MRSYLDRYDELRGQEAQILAISADKRARQAEFRAAIGAPFAFIADTGGELIRLYGIKIPLITIARRATFVIGKGRKILHIDRGGAAIDPAGAAAACSLY